MTFVGRFTAIDKYASFRILIGVETYTQLDLHTKSTHTKSPLYHADGSDWYTVTVKLPKGLRERADSYAHLIEQAVRIRGQVLTYDFTPKDEEGEVTQRVVGWYIQLNTSKGMLPVNGRAVPVEATTDLTTTTTTTTDDTSAPSAHDTKATAKKRKSTSSTSSSSSSSESKSKKTPVGPPPAPVKVKSTSKKSIKVKREPISDDELHSSDDEETDDGDDITTPPRSLDFTTILVSDESQEAEQEQRSLDN